MKMQDDEIQNDIFISEKYGANGYFIPSEPPVKQKPDRSILWAALAIGGGIYALIYGSHLAAMWLAR